LQEFNQVLDADRCFEQFAFVIFDVVQLILTLIRILLISNLVYSKHLCVKISQKVLEVELARGDFAEERDAMGMEKLGILNYLLHIQKAKSMDRFFCFQTSLNLLQYNQYILNCWNYAFDNFFFNVLKGTFAVFVHFLKYLIIRQFFDQKRHKIMWQNLLSPLHKIEDIRSH
jgi:hypothetical protein